MLIAGPCAIESKSQAFRIAEFVKNEGANIFRGSGFKGQNYPTINGKPEYTGIGEEALKIQAEIQDKLKIPCVSDVQSEEQARLLIKYNIKYLMVGARNCDNLCLLRNIKKLYDEHNPTGQIFLKRGPSTTIDELLGYASHLGGKDRVILIERGICSFDRTPQTRWRLDFVGIAYIKQYTDYRILVDPSHGSGDSNLVPLLCAASLAISDGLMVEVHYDPEKSPTDAKQTINFETFKEIAGMYDKRNECDYKQLDADADSHKRFNCSCGKISTTAY